MSIPPGWTPSSLPNFGQEQPIWKNEVMTGIINRRVVETQIITNFRVLQNNNSISLSELHDIIVMNSHRESERSGYYYRHMSYGTGRGRTIGDVVFMKGGQPLIIFKQIQDPTGVCRLAKTARRSLLSAIKQAQKEEAKLRKEQEKESRNYVVRKSKRQQSRYSDSNNLVQVASSSKITCIKCGNSNPTNSNFCVKCGNTLISNCSKCGSNNPSGSAFCNNCGFALA